MDRELAMERIEAIDEQTAAIYREWTPARRLQAAFDMHAHALTWVRHLVTQKHPEWPRDRVELEVRRRVLGVTR